MIIIGYARYANRSLPFSRICIYTLRVMRARTRARYFDAKPFVYKTVDLVMNAPRLEMYSAAGNVIGRNRNANAIISVLASARARARQRRRGG